MKDSNLCKHENTSTFTIGGVVFSKMTDCKDCGKLLNDSSKQGEYPNLLNEQENTK